MASSKRAIALTAALAIAAPGCEFAVKHPAITAGLASGIIGFGGCELDAQRAGPCALAGGIVGVGLGGIAALVLWAVGDRNTDPDAAAIPDPSTGAIGDEPVRVRVRAKQELPPDCPAEILLSFHLRILFQPLRYGCLLVHHAL